MLKRSIVITEFLFLALWACPRAEAACPGGNCTPADATALQTALTTTAVCGDTVTLTAGVTYTGNFTLPNKGCSGTYITLTSSGTLPGTGVRTAPSYSAQMGKLVTATQEPTLQLDDNADYYKILGIELTTSYGGGTTLNLMQGGLYTTVSADLPDHIIIDRVYAHGRNASSEQNVGFAVNGSNIEIRNSYISDIHAVYFEAECIQTANGPGPFLVDNNYLSCAGENFMAGGNVPFIHNMKLRNLTFTNNYLTKDCTWYTAAATIGCVYNGLNFNVKNSFELKCVDTALIDHNIIENSWRGTQAGAVMLLQSANPQNTDPSHPEHGTAPDWNAPDCGVTNITITNNILRHGNVGIVFCGNCFTGLTLPPAMTVVDTSDVLVQNNLLYDLHTVWGDGGGDGFCSQVGNHATNIHWFHNTCDNDSSPNMYGYGFYFVGAGYPSPYDTTPGFSMKDSFIAGYNTGVTGSATAEGTGTLATYSPAGYTFLNNVVGTDVGGGPYPATTDRPSIATFKAQFVDRTSTSNHADNAVDYRLIGGSVYKAGGAKQASDGTDVGVNNWSALPDPLGDGKTPFGGPTTNPPVKLPLPVRIACAAQVSAPSGSATEGMVNLRLCHDGKHVTGWAGLLDSQRVPLSLTSDGQLYSDALQQFTGRLSMAAGPHTVSIIPIYGPAGDGPASRPFSVTVLPAMSAPVNVRIE